MTLSPLPTSSGQFQTWRTSFDARRSASRQETAVSFNSSSFLTNAPPAFFSTPANLFPTRHAPVCKDASFQSQGQRTLPCLMLAAPSSRVPLVRMNLRWVECSMFLAAIPASRSVETQKAAPIGHWKATSAFFTPSVVCLSPVGLTQLGQHSLTLQPASTMETSAHFFLVAFLPAMMTSTTTPQASR